MTFTLPRWTKAKVLIVDLSMNQSQAHHLPVDLLVKKVAPRERGAGQRVLLKLFKCNKLHL
jgi:hypothetical protein